MKLYISECFDETAMLMSDSGQVVAMFDSLEEALEECADWIEVNAYYADHSEIFVD